MSEIAIARALAESQAERDRLTKRVAELEEYKRDADSWFPYPEGRRAYVVVSEGYEPPWHAVFRTREAAEQWLEAAASDPENSYGIGFDAGVEECELPAWRFWNSYEPAPQPKGESQ